MNITKFYSIIPRFLYFRTRCTISGCEWRNYCKPPSVVPRRAIGAKYRTKVLRLQVRLQIWLLLKCTNVKPFTWPWTIEFHNRTIKVRHSPGVGCEAKFDFCTANYRTVLLLHCLNCTALLSRLKKQFQYIKRSLFHNNWNLEIKRTF